MADAQHRRLVEMPADDLSKNFLTAN